TTLQLNVGKMCNRACHHCHGAAGPGRTEITTGETVANILACIHRRRDATRHQTADLAGGAPDLHPRFRRLVAALTARRPPARHRCNLTTLLDPGYEDVAAFLAAHRVEVTASLPCYLEDNVDKQRGRGVYAESIEALRRLNAVGYG